MGLKHISGNKKWGEWNQAKLLDRKSDYGEQFDESKFPIFREVARSSELKAWLDWDDSSYQAFPWETDHKKKDKSIAEKAKRKKAIITALGQREKPGCSMNVILDQSKLLSADTLWKSEAVKNFAEFVARFTGIEFISPK